MSGRAAQVGFVTGGASYHERTLADHRFASRWARSLYLPTLGPEDLDGLDAVVVADRQHAGVLATRAGALLEVAERGATLVVLGENGVHTWLPGVGWEPRPTNFWWWRDGSDPGIRAAGPAHPLWDSATVADLTWHFHGVLEPPAGVTPLLVAEGQAGDGVLLYEDVVSFPGRVVVSTLDPVYHHGSNFMPAATRCLDVILAWLGAAERQ